MRISKAQIVVAILLLVLSSSVLGDDPNQTAGFVNGRGWKAFPLPVKVGYLAGLSEGSEFIKNNSNVLPKNLTYGEISAALDAFYIEPTNANIAVPIALMYVKRKVAGASEAELKDLESKMRKDAQQSAAH